MNPLAVPWVDIGILTFILLSGFIGFVRGFTREILGLLSWGGALVIGVTCGPFLSPFIAPYISSTLLVDVLSAVILFFISLLILVLLSQIFSRQIKGSLLAGLDRSFGFLFGLIRALLLLVLIYIILVFFLKPDAWPLFLNQSRLFPIVGQISRFTLEILPDTSFFNSVKSHLPLKITHTPQELLKTLSTLSPEDNHRAS